MAWRIVLQPNGLLARFSEVVDNFTHLNMSKEEAIELCSEYMGKYEAEEKVQRALEDLLVWDNFSTDEKHKRWAEAIDIVETVHGKSAVEELLKLIK